MPSESLVGDVVVPQSNGDPSVRYLRNDALILEKRSLQHVVLVDSDTNRRTRISSELHGIISLFSDAGTACDVLGSSAASRYAQALDALLRRGLLLDADAPRFVPVRNRSSVAYKFCNASAWRAGVECDFVVLGAPYDLAGALERRFAPTHLRQKSLDYPYRLDIDSEHPIGWFNSGTGRWMLRGARIADAGDVPVDYAAATTDARASIVAALDEVCGTIGIPVLLGGDETSAAAAMRWCASRGETAAVVISPTRSMHCSLTAQVDLHMEAVLEHAGAKRVVVVEGAAEADDRLEAESDVLLSIDMGIIHSSYVQGPASAYSLRLYELKDAIAAVGARCNIVAIQLTGWSAGGVASDATSAAGCELVLAAMEAALQRGSI